MSDYRDLLTACVEAIGLPAKEIVLPEDRWFQREGMRFHYLDWGNAHLPPLVLLHGGGQTSHTWDTSALLLRDSFHLIALDQRGHGDTDWSEEYGWQESVEDAKAFIAHLGLRRFSLLGMSMGGMNAIRFAARNHENLDAPVIVDVGPDSMAGPQSEERKAERERMEKFRKDTQDEKPSREAFLEEAVKFNPLRDPAHLRYSIFHGTRQLENGNWAWKQDQRRRGEEISDEEREKTREGLMEDIRAIPVPTLLVRGGLSKVLADGGGERLRDAMRNAELVTIENASHTVQGDQPEAFARAVAVYLKKTLATRAGN